MAIGYGYSPQYMANGHPVPHRKMYNRDRRHQKEMFYELLSTFFSVPNCDQVMFWGFDDWWNEPGSRFISPGDRFGLLFDGDGCVRTPYYPPSSETRKLGRKRETRKLGRKRETRTLGRKPAYFGVLQALIETKTRP